MQLQRAMAAEAEAAREARAKVSEQSSSRVGDELASLFSRPAVCRLSLGRSVVRQKTFLLASYFNFIRTEAGSSSSRNFSFGNVECWDVATIFNQSPPLQKTVHITQLIYR